MTPKQERFVQEYLIDLNATAAAERAEYRHPNKQGPRLLVNVGVGRAIRAAQAERSERTKIDQDWVIERLSLIVERCMQHEEVLDRDGKPTGEFTFQANPANRALELLGKDIGMFKETLDVNHSGYVAQMPDSQEDPDAWASQHTPTIQ